MKRRSPESMDLSESPYVEFSLTHGKPIARLVGGSSEGKILRLNPRSEKGGSTQFRITDPETRLMPLYTRQIGDYPDRVIFAGSSLCGKSYLAGKIADDYLKQGKNQRIAIFSAVDRDDAYDNLDGDVIRIKCDESILDEPIDMSELADTLCVFDDIDSFANPQISKELNLLRDKCLAAGRHNNIGVMSIAQVLMDGKKTRQNLLNGFKIVLFPQSGGKFQSNNFLKRYMSFTDDMVEEMNSCPSRWIVLQRVKPLHYIHEKGGRIIQ